MKKFEWLEKYRKKEFEIYMKVKNGEDIRKIATELVNENIEILENKIRELEERKKNTNDVGKKISIGHEKSKYEREKEDILQNMKRHIEEEERYIKEIVDEFDDFMIYDMKEVECDSRDNVEPILYEDFILIPVDDEGDGGYSRRYTKKGTDIIDVGELNGKKAYLFSTWIVKYYDYQIIYSSRKVWLAGWDDGHLFLTQVFSSSKSIEDAIEKLKPKVVKEAIAKGKEVKRQGDLWFIRTDLSRNDVKDWKTNYEIRPGHVAEFYSTSRGLASGVVKHDEHVEIDLGDAVWEVARNKIVSRSRQYD